MSTLYHIAVRSEYSFKKAYARISEIVKLPQDIIGIADDNNTFGHAFFEKAMLAAGKKPLFGVRVRVLPKDQMKERNPSRSFELIMIAINNDGLHEMYGIVSKAWKQFFWTPRLSEDDLNEISTNIFTINGSSTIEAGVDFHANNFCTNSTGTIQGGVYIDDNRYINRLDKGIYQLMSGSSKRHDERVYTFEIETDPQYILSQSEVEAYFGKDCIKTTEEIAKSCNVTLSKASLVTFEEDSNISELCYKGASKKGIDLNFQKDYLDRLEYELALIADKGYVDYFLIVSDMIRFAKRNKILVGPSRGSSAGSLVCYLLDITEVDPIKHNLLFERFIDVNRNDLPDIDVDFPDNKRESVINYLKQKYGGENVASLANINRFQSKSAIVEFAQGLGIPPSETAAVKDAIVVRSGGDARASNKLEDTFKDTDAGRDFVKKYPKMKLVQNVENHASHAGKHAAGIIVSNEPLIKFAGTNERDGIIMLDKNSAEYIGLLKIDVLGLRTLSILADICDMIRMPYVDLYNLPLDDKKTFDIFNDMRLDAIFQFDGPSLRNIVKQIGADCFNDLALITALSRPGALNSGGTGRYIEYKKGNEQPVYLSELHKSITEESLGVVVYQEQMMEIARKIGRLSWVDVQKLRRASSKSLGDEYFGQFKDAFLTGCMENDETEENANFYWENIRTAGSWLFNKSHAVSYGLISYWTAYFKAHYPLEFAVANLNHQEDDSAAVKLLRDFKEKEGMDYIPVDADESEARWSVHNGKLLGGLTNIAGIADKTANKIIQARKTGGKLTPSIVKKLMNPVTNFDDLYPCKTKFADFYNDPISCGLKNKVNFIREVTGKGEYIIIGKVVERDVRDRNDYQSVVRREGRRIDGNSLYLRLILEDDTDSVICLISHKKWEKLDGAYYAERLAVDKSWVIIQGTIKSDWRTIDIDKIGILEG